MSNYYFESLDAEMCYSKDYFTSLLAESEQDSMTVYKARPLYGEEFFYCKKYQEVGMKDEGCGRSCPHYSPRNGKNGRCRFSTHTYENTEQPVIIKR